MGVAISVLENQTNFAALSLSDLLEAREHYHLHLMNKANVVGTAVGLYLIRDSEAKRGNPSTAKRRRKRAARTLDNSSIQPYSWPCVLAFVENWVEPEKFKGHFDPTDMVPKRLYLPDGRVVPVCVVEVDNRRQPTIRPSFQSWPDGYLGGGFPIYSYSQGRILSATAGGLVSDGRTIFCLTAQHALGEDGDPIFSTIRGREQRIGSASGAGLRNLPFNQVYPYLPQTTGFAAMDLGLVEVDSADDWTSQTYGLNGDLLALADLNKMNLGMQLIDQPVVARGAASGRLDGRIKALFFRFRATGGFDYVADILIAPGEDTNISRPGDSGAVWHLVEGTKGSTNNAEKPVPLVRPLAVQWGGINFAQGNQTRNFAVGTLICNALRVLGLEYVEQHGVGVRPFWGATGHYGVATMAISRCAETKVRTLMSANADRISFSKGDLEQGDIGGRLDPDKFVPLADVPDVVWKKVPSKVTGGRDGSNNNPEHPTHYADIDEPGRNGTKSLLELCKADFSRVTVPYWQQFYDSVGQTRSAQRGLLPFRVWQFYNEMVSAIDRPNPNLARFVTAAGILSHYVGDACQPLHGSRLADGYQDQATEITTSSGKKRKVWPGQGVHSAYETAMIDSFTKPLLTLIGQKAATPSLATHPIASGQDAAIATVKLMIEAQRQISPKKLCDHYISLGGGKSKSVINGLWVKFGDKTAMTMANGLNLLAQLWDAAWRQGNGNAIGEQQLGAIDLSALMKLYRDPAFVPSLELDDIASVLR
jgi:hypothetical protein